MEEGLVTKWGKLQDVMGARNPTLLAGSGMSDNPDAYAAAKEAAQQSLKTLNGKAPSISYIFFAGDYDPYEINRGLMEVLKDSEFVGGLGDSVIYNDTVMEKGIVVASIQSDFLHVGIASADGFSEDSFEAARKVTKEALSKVSLDSYVDPYMQALRLKGGDIRGIVKIPPYYIHVFTTGFKLPKMGDENKIVVGISDVTGRQVPIWGGAFETSIENFNKKYEIYSLHSGKVYKDGLIIIFMSTSMLYGYSLAHGAKKTGPLSVVTKTSMGGYVVDEISGQKTADWYAKQLNMSKEKFVNGALALSITQRYPIGMVDNMGNIVVRGGGIPSGPNNDSLAFAAPVIEGSPIFLMDGSTDNLFNAITEISNDVHKYTEETASPELVLITSCFTRRNVMGPQFSEDMKRLKDSLGTQRLVGFTSSGEIGSREGELANCHHLTDNVFAFYNKLLTSKKQEG